MQTPKPDEHHLRLHRLAGHWVGQETMHPSEWQPKGGGWDGDVLTLFSESPMMGHMRMTSDFGKSDVLRASMACSRDRETWQGMFDCDYVRQDAS